MADERLDCMTTRDHLRLLWRRRRVLLGVLLACAALAVGYALVAPPLFEARAELVIVRDAGQRSAVLAAAAPLLSVLGEPAPALGGADVATQIQIVASRPSLEAAYGLMHERPELLRRLEREGLSDELFEALPRALQELPPQPSPASWPEGYCELLESLMVAPVEDSDLIEVRCASRDRGLVRDFVNALVLAYLGRSLADAQAATRRTRHYVEQQLEAVELRLTEAEEALRRCGERAGTVAVDEVAREQIGLLARLNEQAVLAEARMQAHGALRGELEGRLAQMDERIETATTIMRNPAITDLQRALAEAEAQRVALLQEYAPDAMPVRRAAAQVAELRAALAATSAEVIGSRQEATNPVAQQLAQELVMAQGEEMAARESMRALQAASQRVKTELSGLPAQQVTLLRLQREVELLDRSYVALKEKQQEYEISERVQRPSSRLVEAAVLPDEPARPRRLLVIAAGMAAGLLLGLLAAGMAEHLDVRLHEPERAARSLGLPVLGTLGRRWQAAEGADEAARAALRAIVGQVRAVAPRGARAGAVVVSADAGEAQALARALAGVAAGEGERVLLVGGTGAGLAEAAAGSQALEVGMGVHELPLGEMPLQRLAPEALEGALAASGADMVLVAAGGTAGLLATLPLMRPDRPAVLCADVRTATLTAFEGLLSLMAERGAPVLGIVALGAARSSSEYIPAQRWTR
ncbi:MAG: GumC family protein [Armatimonadota bacterium]